MAHCVDGASSIFVPFLKDRGLGGGNITGHQGHQGQGHTVGWFALKNMKWQEAARPDRMKPGEPHTWKLQAPRFLNVLKKERWQVRILCTVAA